MKRWALNSFLLALSYSLCFPIFFDLDTLEQTLSYSSSEQSPPPDRWHGKLKTIARHLELYSIDLFRKMILREVRIDHGRAYIAVTHKLHESVYISFTFDES